MGKKIPYFLKHMKCAEWLDALEKDRNQLRKLHDAAVNVTVERDEKLAMLRQLIEKKVKHPHLDKDGGKNRKVLVFTAFADTAAYLYQALHGWAREELHVHIALVTGGGDNRTTFGSSDYAAILTNFSPRSKQRAKMASLAKVTDEIEILIATDCISEGQNLQDCDTLINYDIHWNPVRIIQRFGRIDRIGSRNPVVHLINFWPTKDLDNYISLKDRVEARMALVDMTATADDNLLQDDNIQELIADDLNYRNRQLKKMQHEVLDMEDVGDGASLSYFTLDDFIMELMSYLEANRKALEDASNGLYAVVPAPAGHAVVQPGVIFCLEQRRDDGSAIADAEQKVNPLQPYFLVYVRDDGEVRYNLTSALTGGARAMQTPYLEQLPIPDVPPEKQAPIVALVDQILAAKGVGASPCGCPPVGEHGVMVGDSGKGDRKGSPLHTPPVDIPALEAEIDRLVYALYGLTDDEIAVVEGKK